MHISRLYQEIESDRLICLAEIPPNLSHKARSHTSRFDNNRYSNNAIDVLHKHLKCFLISHGNGSYG